MVLHVIKFLIKFNVMKSLSLMTLCLMIGLSVVGQDKIYKKDKSVIECKVVDIGSSEVKYLEPDMTDGPTISINVDLILKIVLGSGKVIEFKNPLNDPNLYIENKKNAIKLQFLSPLQEHLTFFYEKNIKPGRSFELGIGFIGVGFDTNSSKSSGIAVSGGYKLMKTPDFYSQRNKYAHVLKGSYIKPELLLSVYRNEYEVVGGSQQNITAGALVINIGKQVVYDNFFLFDYSFGLGYGFSNQNGGIINGLFDGSFRVNHYGFILGGDVPIAVTLKIKIGFLFSLSKD